MDLSVELSVEVRVELSVEAESERRTEAELEFFVELTTFGTGGDLVSDDETVEGVGFEDIGEAISSCIFGTKDEVNSNVELLPIPMAKFPEIKIRKINKMQKTFRPHLNS